MQSWRDVFLYAYDATERIDELSAELAERRRVRMDEFRARRKEAEERARARAEEKKKEFKDMLRREAAEIMKEANVASKDELDELKHMIADLKKSVDKLSK